MLHFHHNGKFAHPNCRFVFTAAALVVSVASDFTPLMIRSVVVLGGGSAGLLAALSLKVRHPALAVRVIFSREIGIIGVGEGSTADLPNHLHGFLGIDPADFHRRAKPTWKLGVHFLWGPRPSFDYSFTKTFVGRVDGLPRPIGYYAWDDCDSLDANTALMHEGKAFLRLTNGAPLVQRNIAYHMENADFVAALEHYAHAAGIVFTEGKLRAVEPGPEGVGALVLESGERIAADLFVDASGFRSELLGTALGERFESFDDALFCDRAVAGGWERTTEPVLPYTVAETMDAGWAWQIEHEHHVNRGYVFSSAFLSDEEADAEFRRKNPRVTKTRLVHVPQRPLPAQLGRQCRRHRQQRRLRRAARSHRALRHRQCLARPRLRAGRLRMRPDAQHARHLRSHRRPHVA